MSRYRWGIVAISSLPAPGYRCSLISLQMRHSGTMRSNLSGSGNTLYNGGIAASTKMIADRYYMSLKTGLQRCAAMSVKPMASGLINPTSNRRILLTSGSAHAEQCIISHPSATTGVWHPSLPCHSSKGLPRGCHAGRPVTHRPAGRSALPG
ncbi:hypothetical protein ASZ90_009126 [hydrocarbon metagenome]|uniref:Uncharacterized protein n=1 Tax=hydrocarbon metagenome TaxID=938273 RepID=A0A0W8FJN5_9ZZZZ